VLVAVFVEHSDEEDKSPTTSYGVQVADVCVCGV